VGIFKNETDCSHTHSRGPSFSLLNCISFLINFAITFTTKKNVLMKQVLPGGERQPFVSPVGKYLKLNNHKIYFTNGYI
jgi:hypothetical protein